MVCYKFSWKKITLAKRDSEKSINAFGGIRGDSLLRCGGLRNIHRKQPFIRCHVCHCHTASISLSESNNVLMHVHPYKNDFLIKSTTTRVCTVINILYVIGVLMGLAVYNSIILDLHFPSICYRKLLSPPVVPPLDSAAVGVTRDPTIDDLAEIMPVSSLYILIW